MAGAQLIEVTIGTESVERALRELAERGQNMRPVLGDIGEHLLQSTEDRFRRQVDPEGNPWRPLSLNYRTTKPRNKDKILTLDGHLRRTLRYNVRGSELTVGTDRVYGAVHQFGFEDIPARPYLGISDDDTSELVMILADWLTGEG